MNQFSVCIIDDDEDVRNVMSFALEFEGIRTHPLESGKKAFEYLRSLSPQAYPGLIVVDFTMPDMNGLEFIQLLRRNYPDILGQIPFALSTARCPHELKEMDLPEDVMILEKPLDLNRFIEFAKSFTSGPQQVSSF